MDKIPTDGLEIPKPHVFNLNLTPPAIPAPTGRIHLEAPVSTAPVSTTPVSDWIKAVAAPVTIAPLVMVSSNGIHLEEPFTLAPVTTGQTPAGMIVHGLKTTALSPTTDDTNPVDGLYYDKDQRKTTQDFANIVDKKIVGKTLKQVLTSTAPSTPAAVSAQNSLGETLIFNKLKAFVATDKITPEEATDILTIFTTELFTMVKHKKDVLKNECGKKTCACGTIGNDAYDVDDSAVY